MHSGRKSAPRCQHLDVAHNTRALPISVLRGPDSCMQRWGGLFEYFYNVSAHVPPVMSAKPCVQLQLQQDLANTQEVALKLEAENKEAVRAMQRMRADFKSQEEAREQLAAEKVVLRRENDVLKETVVTLNSELEGLEARMRRNSKPNKEVRGARFKFKFCLPSSMRVHCHCGASAVSSGARHEYSVSAVQSRVQH